MRPGTTPRAHPISLAETFGRWSGERRRDVGVRVVDDALAVAEALALEEPLGHPDRWMQAGHRDQSDRGDHIYTARYTLTAGAAGPKPSITAQTGVVNGAGFQPGIVAGSWTTIFGENLASTTGFQRWDSTGSRRISPARMRRWSEAPGSWCTARG